MGNDGGSIPTRRYLVKHRKKKKVEQKNEIISAKCKLCTISKEALKKPIVADRLGQIYNKTSIIEKLLRKTMPKEFQHIKSLKDVRELNCPLSNNGYLTCQISGTEFTGISNFYFLWSCGCVLSKTSIDELQMKDKCINCDQKFEANKDLISLSYSKSEKLEIQKKLIGAHKKMKNIKQKPTNMILGVNVDVENKAKEKEEVKEDNNEIRKEDKKEEEPKLIKLLGNKTKRDDNQINEK